MSTDLQIYSVTNSYQAKRRRANSVPVGYKSSVASDIGDHFNAARTRNASTSNALNESDVPDDNPARSTIQPPEQVHNATIPHWQRELAKSRVGRHSRASSIVSTRTRLTVQSEDARSVELEAGGQSFRISRDGSAITNTTAPPPYPGPPLDQLDEESDEEDLSMRESLDTVREDSTPVSTPATRSLQSLPVRTHLPTTNGDNESTTELTRRTSPFELPRRFRQVLNTWYGSPTPAETIRTPSISTTAKSLRRTQSDSSSLANFRPWDSTSPDTDGNDTNDSTDDDDDEEQQGPTEITPTSKSTHSHKHKHKHKQPHLVPPALPPRRSPHNQNSSSLDPTDESTAELSAHYTHIIRTLDRTHRTRLHDRDEQLARLRELLNEKDIVYRQQLRDRDHTIESLQAQLNQRDRMINEVKTRMYEVEEAVESRIERARNEVEDVWEGRWKEFEAVLRERLGGGDVNVLRDGGGKGMGGFVNMNRNENERDLVIQNHDDDLDDFNPSGRHEINNKSEKDEHEHESLARVWTSYVQPKQAATRTVRGERDR